MKEAGDKKTAPVGSHFPEVPGAVTFLEIESRVVAASDSREGNGKSVFGGDSVSVGEDAKSRAGTLTMAILQMTLLLSPDMELGVHPREAHFHRRNQPASPVFLAELFQPMGGPSRSRRRRGWVGYVSCAPSLRTQALLCGPLWSYGAHWIPSATHGHVHTLLAHAHTHTRVRASTSLAPHCCSSPALHQPCWLP